MRKRNQRVSFWSHVGPEGLEVDVQVEASFSAPDKNVGDPGGREELLVNGVAVDDSNADSETQERLWNEASERLDDGHDDLPAWCEHG